jgi:hypothetical protein
VLGSAGTEGVGVSKLFVFRYPKWHPDDPPPGGAAAAVVVVVVEGGGGVLLDEVLLLPGNRLALPIIIPVPLISVAAGLDRA